MSKVLDIPRLPAVAESHHYSVVSERAATSKAQTAPTDFTSAEFDAAHTELKRGHAQALQNELAEICERFFVDGPAPDISRLAFIKKEIVRFELDVPLTDEQEILLPAAAACCAFFDRPENSGDSSAVMSYLLTSDMYALANEGLPIEQLTKTLLVPGQIGRQHIDALYGVFLSNAPDALKISCDPDQKALTNFSSLASPTRATLFALESLRTLRGEVFPERFKELLRPLK